MVIATAPRDFCIFPNSWHSTWRNANLHYSIALLFLYVKLFPSCDAAKQRVFRGRRKERGSQQGEVRQKKKVKERKRGRVDVEESQQRKDGRGKEDRGGSRGEGGSLLGLLSIPLVSGSLAGPPPLVVQGEEGSVAVALWPFLCPAGCSAGSTLLYFGANRKGKNILLYFYTNDPLEEEGRRSVEDRDECVCRRFTSHEKLICLLYSFAIKENYC